MLRRLACPRSFAQGSSTLSSREHGDVVQGGRVRDTSRPHDVHLAGARQSCACGADRDEDGGPPLFDPRTAAAGGSADGYDAKPVEMLGCRLYRQHAPRFPSEEIPSQDCFLLGDQAGAPVIDRIDEHIDYLPGLPGLRLIRRAATAYGVR